jgi:hypothetical protein
MLMTFFLGKHIHDQLVSVKKSRQLTLNSLREQTHEI